ncbi:MAG: peptidoglycan editing factor PgeF [Succiniclasticum sp.]|jgi:YfiH family protein|nr:peptidoglycan editing factor PgeF [Succiniclasticum sp.]MEE3479297.1 peptidoglycan editing factor PgeF [Succiniclasticum sp.]
MEDDFVLQTQDGLWWGTFPRFAAAGFLTACSCRLHGTSALVPGTLNLALHVGDEPDRVLADRRRFARAIGVDAERFTTCAQVHGSHVEVVTADKVGSGALALQDGVLPDGRLVRGTVAETDALITDLPDVPLLLFYADCTPVLLADPVTGTIGLAHAGWRGTAAQIAKKTVAALKEHFGVRPENLLAAIGPSIGPCCYEVDDGVRDKMPGYREFFQDRGNGHYLLDLWGVNRRQLEEAGVPAGQIVVSGVCTEDNHELFCSYRYEKGKTGRMGVCLCRPGFAKSGKIE